MKAACCSIWESFLQLYHTLLCRCWSAADQLLCSMFSSWSRPVTKSSFVAGSDLHVWLHHGNTVDYCRAVALRAGDSRSISITCGCGRVWRVEILHVYDRILAFSRGRNGCSSTAFGVRFSLAGSSNAGRGDFRHVSEPPSPELCLRASSRNLLRRSRFLWQWEGMLKYSLLLSYAVSRSELVLCYIRDAMFGKFCRFASCIAYGDIHSSVCSWAFDDRCKPWSFSLLGSFTSLLENPSNNNQNPETTMDQSITTFCHCFAAAMDNRALKQFQQSSLTGL